MSLERTPVAVIRRITNNTSETELQSCLLALSPFAKEGEGEGGGGGRGRETPTRPAGVLFLCSRQLFVSGFHYFRRLSPTAAWPCDSGSRLLPALLPLRQLHLCPSTNVAVIGWPNADCILRLIWVPQNSLHQRLDSLQVRY